MEIRTDLAMEAKSLWEKSAGRTTKLKGVVAKERACDGVPITQVDILDGEGAKALGKPVGSYVTMELPRRPGQLEQLAKVLARELQSLLTLREEDPVLVVGLGNTAVTPDAIGPKSAEGIFVTRHLIDQLPEYFGSLRCVSALSPGVLANTGVESLEIVRAVAEKVKPKCVIAIDALAAGAPERLCRTVQLSDSGIVPGSGVGNGRMGFNRKTLGVPVCCVGVPTVLDAAMFSEDRAKTEGMIVTPKDIDGQVTFLSGLISTGVNLALHPGLSYEEIAQFMPNYARAVM